MTAIVHMPDAARRAARITWYRHRWAVAAILGVFGVATVVLLAEGIAMRVWLHGNGTAHCMSGPWDAICQRNQSSAEQFTGGASGQAAFLAGDTAHALLAVPLAAAMFAGLPWLTREFETGSFRYTWVQGMNPVRWLLSTFGSLAAIAAAAAVACGLVFDWWYRIAQWPVNITPSRGWDWDGFGLSAIALVGWAVFAMALAMLTAAVIRRTVPAMAVFAAGYAGCLFLGQEWLRPRLLAIAPVVRRENWGAFPDPGAYYISSWMTGPDGKVLTPHQEISAYTAASGSKMSQWLTAHHYANWISYQPHDRLVLFQLAMALGLLGLSTLSVLVTVWLLRRRTARS